MIAFGGSGLSILAIRKERLLRDRFELLQRPILDVSINSDAGIAKLPNGDFAFRPGQHKADACCEHQAPI